ncbi:aminotransferase class III-fold pyridoxal phosphate-dependent enzyme [Candidatus Pelagibacter sp. Uisw_121]|uniref:aminotransferase class III-fold pyridoxal phosphate-dependent enzyme n=1 Tax=Candidatus Pelagibacter sp. Uisw_121 TaxID=3230987 RepID=UPI0039EB6A16
MNKGQELLKKAKKIIPGGNQLLSKRSEMFLPGLWPTYYKKAKGCKVWDLNNKVYYDFAGMGVTSCVLGYSNEYINRALIKGLKSGSMCTLNAVEEVELAEELLNIHKWSGMAKFCKSGGEACMVAIRIARAYTNKNNIAFCGYHGWHDWYLATNMNGSKNLDNQLLPGLKAKGVSNSFKNSIKPFLYNDIASFKKLFKNNNNNIGIIIMEPMRGVKPSHNFLRQVKSIAKKNKAILIFDEITSGFKDNYGGLHLKLKVTPDMAIFGKSIGNGYPISAIIGKKDIMQVAQETFISSTMWTDRLGFIAAKVTLKKLKQLNINRLISNYGNKIKKGWIKISKKNKVKISISGQDSIPYLKFDYPNSLEILTYFTQEMLKKGFLAGAQVATSFAYNDKIINKYLKEVDNVFSKIQTCLKNGKFPLKGEIKHSTFKRLTG